MADGIQITGNAAELVARFNRLEPAAREGIRRGIAGALLSIESKVLQGAGVKWRRGAGGLAGRLTSYARLGGAWGVDAAIGFRRTQGFPYELAQEFGAKAKGGGSLAIPISQEARGASDRGLGARSMEGLFVLRANGKAFLARQVKRHLEIHYILKKSIPPRLRFRENVMNNAGLVSDGVMHGWRQARAEA